MSAANSLEVWRTSIVNLLGRNSFRYVSFLDDSSQLSSHIELFGGGSQYCPSGLYSYMHAWSFDHFWHIYSGILLNKVHPRPVNSRVGKHTDVSSHHFEDVLSIKLILGPVLAPATR
jgi:hypothetical protein